MIRSSSGGRPPLGVSAGGSSRRIADSVSAVVSPRNGGRPASISNNTVPKLKMSDRESVGNPRTCSGDM